MRIALSAITVILATSVLTGCNTVSESQYRQAKTVLSTDSSVKREFIKRCVADQQRLSLGDRSTNAAVMNVSVSNYPQVFCKRMTNAVTNGKMTYADYKGVMSGGGDYAKLVRIMQGR